jgi:hypothetical protein
VVARHRSRGPRDAPHTVAPTLVHPGARESRAPLSTRIREPAGVPYTALCRQRSSSHGHNAVWGSPGNGLSEKRATATKKAVETPGGGRCHSRRTGRSRHRRAASRSGGAMSAERDGRPAERRNGPRGAAAERGSSKHRPSVTFGCASAPARLPSTTRVATTNRSPTVASGRLDGLPRHHHTILRHALPEDSVWPDGHRIPPSCAGGPKPATRPLRPKGLRSPWQGPLAAPIGVMPGLTMCTSNRELPSHIVKPGTSHRCAPSRAPQGPRIVCSSEHLNSRNGVPYTVLCRRRSSFDGHNTVWGSPGNGLPENCVTATKQAVETPGGGRNRPRITTASRHRRAASRSGGAMSAERDGRPVHRRTT